MIVYVASVDGRRGLKIGYTSQPEQRRKALASQHGNAAFEHQQPCLMPQQVEAATHWILRERHITAEWYDVTVEEARQAIADAEIMVSKGEAPPQRINSVRPYSFGRRDILVSVSLSSDESRALDDWRAQHLIFSRSDAIRRLIAEGIKRAAEAPAKK